MKALVVPRAGTAPAKDELVALARERLTGYKVPRSIDYVDDLPHTPSGNVLKRELRERYGGARPPARPPA